MGEQLMPFYYADEYRIRLCDDTHAPWWVEVSKEVYSDLEIGQRYEIKK